MKNVLLVAPQPFYTVRGTPINVKAMVSALVNGGYRVTLLTLPFGEDIPLNGVEVIRVSHLPWIRSVPIGPSFSKLSYLILFCLKVSSLTRKQKFQLLHGIEEGAFAAGLIGILRGIPYIADVDSCMPSQLRESRIGKIPGLVALFSVVGNFFLRRASGALTVCSALTRKVNRVDPRIPVFQIEDFPFSDALRVDSTKLGALRRRFSERRVILYTGNLESYQGVELLIQSFAKCEAESAVLLIVGGPNERIAHLKTLALECRVGERVVSEGARPADEMGAYMAFADILVSPRLVGENVPLKLYTYLASGKPLVATAIGSHTQIISDSTAFLGAPTEYEFARALASALESSRERLLEISQRALKLVEERYSEGEFRRKLLSAYGELVPVPEFSPEVSEARAHG